jgi:hypothetical protein
MVDNNDWPRLRKDATDEQRLAAIRRLFEQYDWERDDHQYALEALEQYAQTPESAQ